VLSHDTYTLIGSPTYHSVFSMLNVVLQFPAPKPKKPPMWVLWTD